MAQVYNKIYSEEIYENVLQRNKDICNDFLIECKAKKLAVSTQKQYANDLRIIVCYIYQYVGNKCLLDLSKRDFRNFMIHATEEYGMSSARVNRLLSVIHSLLDFCEDDEEEYKEYDRNVSSKIKGLPKEEVREVVFLPDDAIMKLWDKLMKEKRYKEATLLGVLYDSGCRRNEIEQIERDSINEQNNASNRVKGKRGKVFSVLYFRLTKEAFIKYEEERTDDSKKLFPSPGGGESSYAWIYNTVLRWRKDLLEITGEEYNINAHSFRHSFVQNMLSGEHYLCRELNLGPIPLEKVKALCHHESSDTTLKYAKDEEDKEIEELFGIKL